MTVGCRNDQEEDTETLGLVLGEKGAHYYIEQNLYAKKMFTRYGTRLENWGQNTIGD